MNTTEQKADIAIVGAGIVGLAMAYHSAKAGKSVVVFERDDKANGASVRNFGMVWPIGQPSGIPLERSLRSRELWLEICQEAGIWNDPVGSLLLAYQEDEWQVVNEFVETTQAHPYEVELMSPDRILEISPAANPDGLMGGLFSKTEVIVDPREVPGKMVRLLQEKYSVRFRFQTVVKEIQENQIQTPSEKWHIEHTYLCTGTDLETLYPDQYALIPLTKVKLQMMRTAPQPDKWRMGPSIYGGLTLQHYSSFAHCNSLSALKERIETQTPWFNQWGIHVMMSQNGLGELVIGDSHEYGGTHDPFLKEEINDYILDYLRKLVRVPDLDINARWYGVYAKLPGHTEKIIQPESSVTIVTGVGGAGMTFSFGLAEAVVKGQLNPTKSI